MRLGDCYVNHRLMAYLNIDDLYEGLFDIKREVRQMSLYMIKDFYVKEDPILLRANAL